MRRSFARLLGLQFALVAASLARAASFYISPSGSNANPGIEAASFATLERVRAAVRVAKADDIPPGGITVFLRGGEYVLAETFVLTPQDSGAPDRTVRYQTFPGESPVLTSARAIAGRCAVTDYPAETSARARRQLYMAEIAPGWSFRSLHIDGEPQQIARFPNSDLKDLRQWPKIGGAPRITADGMWAEVPAGLPGPLPTNGDVEVKFLAVEWWNTLAVLRGREEDRLLLASRNPNIWVMGGRYVCNEGDGAFSLRNALALLDEPGEWCVDSAAGRAYLWPKDGRVAGCQIAVSTLTQLMRLQGDDLTPRTNDWRVKFDAAGARVESAVRPLAYAAPDAFAQLVRHVEIRGIVFAATDRLPEDRWPAEWLKRNSENPDATL